ncbi:hypothetical protein LPN01_09715 [Sphingomonas sp. A2-49]|uniref:hypothetical protein n=1 Tax=Sphingomonas sp. A2-49 TaxID=1391375 RepID=UPI0021CF7988|nr:hypothetical protein [Sphingomonas sp. A2-49]MCU6454356.1 hypothetical protein [Sphingomonas sp. A2-49]
MRVVTQDGTIELGAVEAAPTIGITDYSRRVTDDFGVTTVVKRGFARRMSVRLAVPFEDVDAIQRQLAALRATPALWIADDDIASLSVTGLYKDFELDLAVPPISYCTLTVEGIVEDDAFVDSGVDPAPTGRASSLLMLQPIAVTDAVLSTSSVAEADAPEWSVATTYAAGTRVIKAATHRIYESLAGANVGNDPAGTSGKWFDVGPTGRWAMFDQALGSVTTSASAIVLTLKPGPAVTGLAVLDTNAATVRVQAGSYDRTQAVVDGAGSALFLDLAAPAGANVTVTLTPAAATATPRPWDDGARWSDYASWRDTLGAGDGTVSVGTLLIGRLTGLGVTEASPTASITDYSRKVVDDFGEVSIVPRAWAKKMAAKALIRTDAVDQVAGRIAAARALPSLWLGDAGLDSLTVYGFFRDFSIEIGTSVSKLSLSIEGLSTAGKVVPIGGGAGSVDWPDIGDPAGTKPTDNADKTSENTSKDTAAVGGRPTTQVLSEFDAMKARAQAIDNVTIPAINKAVADANTAIGTTRAAADQAVALANQRIDGARSDLNQAVLDLAAEVTRAKGADEQLSQRIDTISVSGGYDDTQVRALISTVDTARADDKRAIGQRVDTVVTDYQNRDQATNTRITTTATGLSDADRALGQRIDAVTTDYRDLNTATNTRITSSVTALSDADRAIGERIDQLVASGGGGSEGVDTVARTEIARVETASIARDGAIGQRIDSVQSSFTAAKGITPNADFSAGEANWSQAGFTFPSYGAGRVAQSAAGQYCQLGMTGGAKVVDTGRGMRLHCVFTVYGPAQVTYVGLSMYDASGAFIGNSYVDNVHGMLPAGTYTVDQLYTGLWPATDGLQFQVGGKFIPRVNVVRATFLANYPEGAGPFAGGYVQVHSFWLEEVGTAQLTDARVAEVATTAAGAAQAVANLTTSVNTRFQGVDLTLGGYDQRITTLSNASQGYAGRIQTLEAVAQGGGNLVPNTALATLDGWALTFNAGALATMTLNRAGEPYMIGGYENNLTLYRAQAGDGLCAEAQSARFAVRPGSFLQFYALTSNHRSNVWTSLFFYRADGSLAGYAGEFMSPRINEGGKSIAGWDLTGSKSVQVPADAVAAAFVFRLYNVSVDGYGWMSRPFVTEVQAGTNTWAPYAPGNDRTVIGAVSARVTATENTLADLPNRYAAASRTAALEAQVNFAADSGLQRAVNARIEDRAAAIADAKAGAVAQTVTELTSEYRGTKATVQQQAGTIVDLQGRASAYVRFLATAGNGRAQLTLSADANGGGGADLIGDLSISGNLLVGGSVITDKIAQNGITNTVAISGMSQFNIPAGEVGESARLSIASNGGTMKVDVQSDGNRNSGAGIMKVQLFAAYSGGEVALSRQVAFSPSNTAVPVSLFQITGFPAGTAVQFFLRFSVPSGAWSYSDAAIAVTEFKR